MVFVVDVFFSLFHFGDHSVSFSFVLYSLFVYLVYVWCGVPDLYIYIYTTHGRRGDTDI